MPYLADPVKRQAIEDAVRHLDVASMDGAELNFTLCTILNQFVSNDYRDNVRYRRINEAMGAAVLAPMEWARRLVAPYEDLKARENGDLLWPR